MILKYTKHLALVLAALALTAACRTVNPEDNASIVLSTGRPVGEVRGTALVNELIKTRLLNPEDLNTETFQIEMAAGFEIFAMRGLLGQYTEGGSSSTFRGGEPNPFGLMLWHQVIAKLSTGIGQSCAQSEGPAQVETGNGFYSFNASFSGKLKAVCAWPATDEEQNAAASKLWRSVMGIGAAEEELAFKAFFVGSESPLKDATREQRVEAMFVAMMMNPHFLLEK